MLQQQRKPSATILSCSIRNRRRQSYDHENQGHAAQWETDDIPEGVILDDGIPTYENKVWVPEELHNEVVKLSARTPTTRSLRYTQNKGTSATVLPHQRN